MTLMSMTLALVARKTSGVFLKKTPEVMRVVGDVTRRRAQEETYHAHARAQALGLSAGLD
jgi:hypothetical protein